MTTLPSSRGGRRRGAVAVWVALTLSLLLGVAAVAVDSGLLMAERRHAQAAADAGALGAALDLGSDASPYTVTKLMATNIATANYTDTTHLTVTPHIPPTSGTFSNTTNYATGKYVEVIVQWDQPRLFSAIFGSGNISVSARAVAQAGSPSNWGASILTLNAAAAKGVELSGGSFLSVPGAILIDSTNSSTALRVGGGSITAPKIDIVGGYSLSGGAVASPTPTTGVTRTEDPLTSLAVPVIGTDTPSTPQTPSSGWNGYNTSGTTAYIAPSGATTIYPGRYAGIQVNSGSTVTMSPGIYYLTGNGSSSGHILLISGSSAKLNGTGVMIYNGELNGSTANPSQVGQMEIKSGAQVNLTPPTSGTWKGINIFQDRNATTQMTISGGSGTNISGMVYAAKAAVSATGGSTIVPGSSFIVGSLLISGGGSFSLPVPSTPVPIPGAGPRVALVE